MPSNFDLRQIIDDNSAAAATDKPNSALAPAASTSNAVASTSISVPPPSMLRGKTIEEIVNTWTSELDKHVREFNLFAGEVAVWDRALIENSKNVCMLLFGPLQKY